MIFNLTQPVLDSAPKFTYTGTYEYIDDGSGNWRIKFLTSGVFKPLKNMAIDAFLLGGGGGGGTKPTESLVGSSGGGGGFTKTVRAVNLTKNNDYEIVVGNGGAPGVDGGSTTAFNETAVGGKKGSSLTGAKRSVPGGSGGSGGGGANTYSDGNPGSGGSDGSNGSHTSGAGGGAGGTGQGTTTREFGETTGDLYSGGGGGTYYMQAHQKKYAAGGDGGGAKGGESASDNTGGGGGGYGGYGGSGIVVIRKHKEAAA